MLTNFHLELFHVVLFVDNLIEEVFELIILQDAPAENLSFDIVNLREEDLDGNEFLERYSRVVVTKLEAYFVDLLAENLDFLARQVRQFRSEHHTRRDFLFFIWLQCEEMVVPQILFELELQVDNVTDTNAVFIFEEELDQA